MGTHEGQYVGKLSILYVIKGNIKRTQLLYCIRKYISNLLPNFLEDFGPNFFIAEAVFSIRNTLNPSFTEVC